MPNAESADFIDLHVHVGQWEETYFQPEKICEKLLDECGFSLLGISSTSACRTYYNAEELINEMLPLFKRWPDKIFHWFWVHPEHLPNSLVFSSKVPVHGLKIHPYGHNWHKHCGALEKAFLLASNHNIPVLIHTGGKPEAEPRYLLPILQKFPNLQVILAHARPVDQAMEVAALCPEVWFDTAFVPPENIKEAFNKGFSERFVFGSDYPVNGPVRQITMQQVLATYPQEWHELFQRNTVRFLNCCRSKSAEL